MNTLEVKTVIWKLRAMMSSAVIFENGELTELIREIDRTETLAPVMQPTWYRSAMGDLDDLRRLAEAACSFVARARCLAATANTEGQNDGDG